MQDRDPQELPSGPAAALCSHRPERLFFQAQQEGEESGLKSVLTSAVAENKFIVLDELKFDEIKTKNFVQVMNNLKVDKALVVLNEKDANVEMSARNIPDVKMALTNTINVYDILKYNTVVVTKAAAETIQEVYA